MMDVLREVCQAWFWFYSLEHLHQASLRNLLANRLPVPPRAVPKHPGKARCTAKSQISRFQPAGGSVVQRFLLFNAPGYCLSKRHSAHSSPPMQTKRNVRQSHGSSVDANPLGPSQLHVLQSARQSPQLARRLQADRARRPLIAQANILRALDQLGNAIFIPVVLLFHEIFQVLVSASNVVSMARQTAFIWVSERHNGLTARESDLSGLEGLCNV